MSQAASSVTRDPRIAVDALQRDTRALPVRRLAGAEVFGDDVPDRLAALLVDRGPARDLVGLAGFQRLAVVELEFGDAPADGFRRRAGIGEAADADHVAA